MQKYSIILTLTEKILGTIPYDPEVYFTFIESKKPDDIRDIEVDSVEKKEEKGWTGFLKDDKGLYIYDYMIRGFLKYAGNVLKDTEGIKTKALKNKISKWVFVFPRKIYFNIPKADGLIERPLRGQTPQGERTCLARSDYVEAGRVINFEIHVLSTITEKMLKAILDYGQYQGLGQFRSGSYGRFTYKLEKM